MSPLPLVQVNEHRAVATATPYDREAGLRALQAGAARALEERWHGERGEENRRRQSERSRSWWAGLTSEQRAEQAELIAPRRTPGRTEASSGA